MGGDSWSEGHWFESQQQSRVVFILWSFVVRLPTLCLIPPNDTKNCIEEMKEESNRANGRSVFSCVFAKTFDKTQATVDCVNALLRMRLKTWLKSPWKIGVWIARLIARFGKVKFDQKLFDNFRHLTRPDRQIVIKYWFFKLWIILCIFIGYFQTTIDAISNMENNHPPLGTGIRT